MRHLQGCEPIGGEILRQLRSNPPNRRKRRMYGMCCTTGCRSPVLLDMRESRLIQSSPGFERELGLKCFGKEVCLVRSDPTQSSPSKAAPLDSQDRRHSPGRHWLLSFLLWAWIVFWLFGFLVYVVSLADGALSFGLALFGIGIATVAELLALFIGDVKRGRTRWRLRRRVGHRPSEAEVRDELWRARTLGWVPWRR